MDAIWPDLTNNDIKNLQRVKSTTLQPGVSNELKGYNEFVLFGEELEMWTAQLKQKYYYFYNALTWQNPNNSVVRKEGEGFGLFV